MADAGGQQRMEARKQENKGTQKQTFTSRFYWLRIHPSDLLPLRQYCFARSSLRRTISAWPPLLWHLAFMLMLRTSVLAPRSLPVANLRLGTVAGLRAAPLDL